MLHQLAILASVMEAAILATSCRKLLHQLHAIACDAGNLIQCATRAATLTLALPASLYHTTPLAHNRINRSVSVSMSIGMGMNVNALELCNGICCKDTYSTL